ncbi:MAG: zf-TFIIB domain-containing protein [Ignavibacteriaceae bacterium]
MICPVCKEPMVVLELDQVEIDFCANCGGIWLDLGELELLLESKTEREKLMSSFKEDTSTKEKSYPCPICGKRMSKILVGENEKVLVDKCRKEHGIWFDKGELNSVIENASENKGSKVINHLKQMFKNSVDSK